jgi:alginate O-acetyltransferase complex protein AlgI
MIFSSPVFLFIFLPIFIIIGFSIGKRLRNLFLVAASLFFYSWGEPRYIILLISSIFVNYLFSFFIDSSQRNNKQTRRRLWLSLALVFNLALLVGFKYTGFLAGSWNDVAGAVLGFPLGISFFTFSAISYLIDIYRKDTQYERSPMYVALYISFFPKLLAGPFVQYRHIKEQITNRTISTDKLAGGIQRFIIGLGKKVLIANTLGATADQIFAISPAQFALYQNYP